MRIKTERRKAIVNKRGEAFNITVNDAMFDILSRKLYKNPPVAVIRELVANGFDACADDVRVYMDSTHRYLRVEDNGCGMAHDTVMELYSTYGESSKRNDNNAFGCYGLGAKSPFAVAPFFRVKTKCEGEDTWREYLCEHTTGVPTIRLVQEIPANKKEHGTIVTIDDAEEPVFTINTIKNNNLKFISHKWRTFVDGNEVTFDAYDSLVIDKDITLYVRRGVHVSSSNTKWFNDTRNINIITGTGVYNTTLKDLGVVGNVHFFNFFGAENIAIEVPVGSVGVTPSKDDLLLNPEDKNYLVDGFKRVDTWLKNIYEEVKAECAKYSCFNPNDYEIGKWACKNNTHIIPFDVALIARLNEEGMHLLPSIFISHGDDFYNSLFQYAFGKANNIPYVFVRNKFPAYASSKRIEGTLRDLGFKHYHHNVFEDEKEMEKAIFYPFLFVGKDIFTRVMRVYDEKQQEKIIEAVRESYKASRKKKHVPNEYVEYYDDWMEKQRIKAEDFEKEVNKKAEDGVVLIPVKEESKASSLRDMTTRPIVVIPMPSIRKLKARGNIKVVSPIEVVLEHVFSKPENTYAFVKYVFERHDKGLTEEEKKKIEQLRGIFYYDYSLGGKFSKAANLYVNRTAYEMIALDNEIDIEEVLKRNRDKVKEALKEAFECVIWRLKEKYGKMARWVLNNIIEQPSVASKIEKAITTLVSVVDMDKQDAAQEVKNLMKKYGEV